MPYYKKTFPKFIAEKYKNWKNLEKYWNPECFNLLEGMLQMNPLERLTAKAALSHIFFQKNYSEKNE